MKIYIKSTKCLGEGMTLRQWIEEYGDEFINDHIIICSMEPYKEEYPDDVVGVLFDGTIEDLRNTPTDGFAESADNYLLQKDLDRCIITKCKSMPDGISLYISNYVTSNTSCTSSTKITASTNYDSHEVYSHGKNKFSVYVKHVDDPDSFQCQVSVIKPYDDAEYAWARKVSPRDVDIIQNGKVVDHYTVPEWNEDNYEDETEYINDVVDMICVALLDYNRDIKPRIIHN